MPITIQSIRPIYRKGRADSIFPNGAFFQLMKLFALEEAKLSLRLVKREDEMQ